MRLTQHAARRPHAFTLTELLVTLTGLALAAVLITPALDSSRQEARHAGSVGNLRTLGKANASYAALNEGRISGFDWDFDDGEIADFGGGFSGIVFDVGGGESFAGEDHLEIAQLQFAAILRRHTGRFAGLFDDPAGIRPSTTRVPHRRYSHIPLLDWFGGSATDPLAVGPLDMNLQAFQADPLDFEHMPGGDPETPTFSSWDDPQVINRWPFASSYQTTTYAWSPSRVRRDSSTMLVRPAADGTLLGLTGSPQLINISFRPQPMADVAFPGLKAHMFEEFDYREGLGVEGRYFADPEASVNVLFFDGSTRLVETTDANPGWDTNVDICDQDATHELAYISIDTRYFRDYSDAAFPQPYRWTRGGLEGIDVGADEINTTNWCD